MVYHPSNPFQHPLCGWKDIKALMYDLKMICQSVAEDFLLGNGLAFKDTRGNSIILCEKLGGKRGYLLQFRRLLSVKTVCLQKFNLVSSESQRIRIAFS